MGVTTVFEVEASVSALALADAFERAPEAEFRFERTVTNSPERRLPPVWASGLGTEEARDLFAADPTVADAELLGEDDGAQLFDVVFDGGICEFVDAIFERGGTVLRAGATDHQWTFQLRFADHGDIGTAFNDEFCERFDATVTRLYRSTESPVPRTAVTEKQRQALDTALGLGYYDVPRTVDLESVGEELGISRQAVSERLRRGHEMLVTDYVGKRDDEAHDRQ